MTSNFHAPFWSSGRRSDPPIDCNGTRPWNGHHTKSNLTLDPGEDSAWYPRFTGVLQAAAAHAWPTTDLFPSFGMPSLPMTQDNFRWCNKCQGMFLGGSSVSRCPAGGGHNGTGSGNYSLMRNSQFPYGQQDWRACKKCQSVFFGPKTLGVCPSGGPHDLSGSNNYTLVHNSPYNEPQIDRRWCNKCQGLFYAGFGPGVCPAGGGHTKTGSGNYSVAFVV